MRPKVVITVLLVALLVIIGAIILKSSFVGNHETDALAANKSASTTEPSTSSSLGSASQGNGLQASGSPRSESIKALKRGNLKAGETNSAEAAENAIAAQLDDIREISAQADPTNNITVTIPALLDYLSSKEKEVSQSALEAIKHLDDTNAIPGLLQAADAMTDPREKVAIYDVIEYLKLPNITDLKK